MNSVSKAFDVQEIQNSLCQLDDVQAARIVVGADNEIEEIHIVAAPAKGAKQLVRDVETTLMACYGIPVNHRKISVAQVSGYPDVSTEIRPSGRNGDSPERDGSRLRIISVNSEVSGARARVSVSLGLGDGVHEGVAEGYASQTERLRLMAQATIDAVLKFAPSIYFTLEDVAIVNLGKESVAVACITHVGSFGEHILVGSALVRQNNKDSIVRATLDAINRRFSFLKTV